MLTDIQAEVRRAAAAQVRLALSLTNAAPRSDAWTSEELAELASRARAQSQDSAIPVFILAGRVERDEGRVAGLALGSVAFVFPEEALPPPVPSSGAGLPLVLRHPRIDEVVRAVTIHEIGHVLGLVDNGLPMVVPHSDGGVHSDDPGSVMYAGVDTTFDYLVPGQERPIPFRFDENDVQDIRAFQASCRTQGQV